MEPKKSCYYRYPAVTPSPSPYFVQGNLYSIATPQSEARHPFLPLYAARAPPSVPNWRRSQPQLDANTQLDENTARPEVRVFGPFGVTILGPYCADCRTKVGSSRQQLARHLSQHAATYGPLDIVSFSDGLDARIASSVPDSVDEIVRATRKAFVCSCGQAFPQKGNLKSHCASTKASSCVFVEACKSELVVETICGRLFPRWHLDDIISSKKLLPIKKPENRTTDHETVSFLLPLLRKHETAEMYVSMFRPLCDGGTLATTLVEFLDRWDLPLVDERFNRLMEAAEEWLGDVRLQIDLIPANYRAKLLVFDGQDIGEVRQNYTFQLRHKESTLFLELSKLLRFAYRTPGFADLFRTIDSGTVPRILQRLFLQRVETFQSHPTVVHYCLSRCFRRRHDTIEMLVAGDSSSIMSSVMHLLRAGLCSFCYLSSRNSDRTAEEMVAAANQSRALNILSPYVRRLREIQREKPRQGLQSTTPEGDINIDGLVFPRSLWKKEIPIVLGKLEELFGCIFLGDEWRVFLTASIEVYGDMRFRTATSSDEDLVLGLVFEQAAFDQIAAHLGLSFHGHGAGSMRNQELISLSREYLMFHDGTVRYSAQPIKRFRSLSLAKPPVDRMLPWKVARFYLLYHRVRVIKELATERALYFSEEYSVRHAVAEIYCLRNVPTMLQVRHKVASQTNILFPEGTLKTAIAATDEVLEQSGHAASTGQDQYKTEIVDGLELVHRRYQGGLGAATLRPEASSSSFSPLYFLRKLYGPEAIFRSAGQEQLAELVLRKEIDQHVFVGLPCGAGKSIAWLLPAVAKAFKTIVFFPYKFLAYFMEEASRLALDGHGVSMACLVGTVDLKERLPTLVELPDIVFLSLEAGAELLVNHSGYIKEWKRRWDLRFVVDEVHTIHDECSFRPPYQELPALSRFGIPTFVMSGTLVDRYRTLTMKSLGLADSEDSYTCIGVEETDVDYPDGFKIDCLVRKDPVATCLDDVKEVLKDPSNTRSIHILCATVAEANAIAEALLPLVPVVVSHSGLGDKDQRAAAKGWVSCSAMVFVTTTGALVGNECANCFFVYIVGLFHSLGSVRQAFGRLRKSQRGSKGWIRVVVPVVTNTLRNHRHKDDRWSYDFLTLYGLIDDDYNYYRSVMTGIGVYDWVRKVDGCRMKSLLFPFGENCSSCRVCDRCRSSPLLRLALAQDIGQQAIASTAVLCRNIFQRLKESCLICGHSGCNGIECGSTGGCYQCGESGHFTRECSLNSREIFGDRGCYHCFDTKARVGWLNHNYGTACPFQKRLKRMCFEGWRKTGHASFGLFLSELVASGSMFNCLVATIGGTTEFKYRRLQVVHALEPKCRSEDWSSSEKKSLPLLPPDCVEGNHDLSNKGDLVVHSNATQARSLYQYLASTNSSNRKHRMFVHGVFYRNIFPGVHVVDGRESTILDVDCQDGTKTTIKITMCCSSALLNAATKLGGSWGGAGNANRPGDRVQMCVAGLRNAKTGQEYVIKKDHEDLVLEASKAAADWAEAHYPEVVKSIQEAESTKGGREIAYMDSRMGRTTVQSIDLCNADHFDVNDSSLSLSIFTEVIPGDATNWRFVMPNLSFDGSKGVVVDLVHGTAISWDGTKVRHCTAEPTTHPNNHVYGLFYGSCR